MGEKQYKNRMHLLFYGTCFLIIISMTGGCIIPHKKVQVLPAGGTPVEQAAMMVNKGEFTDALKAYGKIARSYPRDAPGDRALFEMGLIWVYPGNSKRSYYESLKCFKRLLRDYPRSSLREETGAWVEVLTRLTRYDDQIKDQKDKINSYSDQISTYKEQIKSYQEQISALKEIDIGIEEKKRKGIPEE